MAYTVDPSTAIGRVRLLIADRHGESDAIFPDDTAIQAFIDLAPGGNILRAAALGCLAIAADETLIQKRITINELSTDGPSEASALNALAQRYMELADKMDEVGGTEGEQEANLPFAFGEWATTPAARREHFLNNILREAV